MSRGSVRKTGGQAGPPTSNKWSEGQEARAYNSGADLADRPGCQFDVLPSQVVFDYEVGNADDGDGDGAGGDKVSVKSQEQEKRCYSQETETKDTKEHNLVALGKIELADHRQWKHEDDDIRGDVSACVDIPPWEKR